MKKENEGVSNLSWDSCGKHSHSMIKVPTVAPFPEATQPGHRTPTISSCLGQITLVLDFIGKCHHWQKSLLIKNYKFQSLKDSIGKKKKVPVCLFFFSSKIACMLLSYCKQTSSSISLYIFFQNQKEKHITFGNFVFLKIICISRSCP